MRDQWHSGEKRRLASLWEREAREAGIRRSYSPEDVLRLRNSFPIPHALPERGSRRLRDLLETEDYVAALGALTGNQAMQQVKAGLKAIYLSGWQVAADANLAGQMYPDQSLYPVDYRERGMLAYSELQQSEFAAERLGYTATEHQREVGTGYFDLVREVITRGAASTGAMEGSTEADQFREEGVPPQQASL